MPCYDDRYATDSVHCSYQMLIGTLQRRLERLSRITEDLSTVLETGGRPEDLSPETREWITERNAWNTQQKEFQTT